MCYRLADYAIGSTSARGRVFPESSHPYRKDFERDRDRIIHSSAFRRLEGKTQVFMPGLDDFYRTRLTHTIEVAQVARTIAKALKLNEALVEAICLAHDLGHSPFGHAGESTLNDIMAGRGGFEHNRQTLRIVDLIEQPYPAFKGLNLAYETRLGLAKHHTPYDRPETAGFAEKNCSLEGQVADLADRVAYNCHDLEDGMRAGLIQNGSLKSVEIFQIARAKIKADSIPDPAMARTRTAKTVIEYLVSDCIDTSSKRLKELNIKTVDQVYDHKENLIAFSEGSSRYLQQLERFLLDNFYNHPTLIDTAANVKVWLNRLFVHLTGNPSLMPPFFQRLIKSEGIERTVCDYIAGMTDRFCLEMADKAKGLIKT